MIKRACVVASLLVLLLTSCGQTTDPTEEMLRHCEIQANGRLPHACRACPDCIVP